MSLLAILCHGQMVTQQQAQQKALSFMNRKGMTTTKGIKAAPLSHFTADKVPLYVFNSSTGKGFVVISADERTEEILGYSTEGQFDESNIPETMRKWLDDYANQITQLQKGKLQAVPMPVKTNKAISPMVKTMWSQGQATISGNAYNYLCPTINGVHCVTGCVATAMAQVMRYHKWPATSTSIPAFIPNEKIGSMTSLPPLSFDWNNMVNRYDQGQTTNQNRAVAQLMLYCGQAVEMDYGITESGASAGNIVNALRTYFGYDINTRYVHRTDYSVEGWDNLIYNEINNGRPVIYSGTNLGGGHAFVCDGYDGQGFYHINWGWSGMYNGYFKLSILNPNGGGTGGSSSNSGYTKNQGAVIGIQKPTGNNKEDRALSLHDYMYSDSIIFAEFLNRTGLTGTFEYGFKYLKTGTTHYYSIMGSRELEPFYSIKGGLNLNNLSLANGTYRFYPCSSLQGSGIQHVLGDYKIYFEVVMSNGVVTNITSHPTMNNLQFSLSCESNKIVGLTQELTLTLINHGDEHNDLDFYLFATKSDTPTEKDLADGIHMSVASNATETSSLFFTPNSTGKWNLWVGLGNDNEVTLVNSKEVNISKAPTAESKLSVVSYEIDNKENTVFKVKVKNIGSQSYYMPIICFLFEEGKDKYITAQISPYQNIEPNATSDLEFQFESLEAGHKYSVALNDYIYHNSSDYRMFGNYYSFTVETPAPNTSKSYLALSPDGKTLTFYHDNEKAEHTETVYDLDGYQGLGGKEAEVVTKVVFDSSFANAKPTSTYKWFYGMSMLTSIDGMKYLNTTEVSNMTYMFRGCSKLKDIDLNSFDTSNVTEMSDMFGDCKSLTSLNLSNFNTEKVKAMQNMFANCNHIEYLDLSSFNTSNVEDMSGMFLFQGILKNIVFGDNFITSKVSSMREMFDGCYSLESLDVSSFNTSNVQNMAAMFERCSSLTVLDVSGFDIKDGANTLSMFRDCSSLQKLCISHSFSRIDDKACEGVGTEEKPCHIIAPKGFDFGTAVNGKFRWMAGWFTLGKMDDVEDDTDISLLDNAIYVKPASALVGGEKPICIFLKNKGEVAAYHFSLKLPEGLEMAMNSDGKYKANLIIDRHDNHILTVNRVDSIYLFNVYSPSRAELTRNEGDVIEINLNISEDMKEGTYPIRIINASISTPDGTALPVKDTKSTITIENYMRGDVNNDKVVDIADAVCIVNLMVRKPNSIFINQAGDVNEDGGIDLADAVSIVNIVVGMAAAQSIDAIDEEQ